MSNVYAFDVDHTLEVSNGPVKLASLVELREVGHVVGLCGNWAMVTLQVPQWHRFLSFVSAGTSTKADFLRDLKRYTRADDYVMVGNDPFDSKWAAVPDISGLSSDRIAAEQAEWRFITEDAFAQGAR